MIICVKAPEHPAFPPISLIAVDLDGTLLRSDRSLCPDSAAALRAAARRGLAVVLATARPPRSVRPIYDALGLCTPTLNYNGAVVYDPPAGRVLFHQPMDGATARELVALARQVEPEVLVSIEVMDTWHTDRLDPALMTETARAFEPDYLGPLDRVLAGDVTKVMLLADTARLERVHAAVRAHMGTRVAIAMSDAHLLQVMHPSVDKGTALARLAAQMGIAPANILAIGDAPNDAGMLRMAGVGVAMASGWDEAKAAADAVAPGNDEAGVAWAVRQFVEGRL